NLNIYCDRDSSFGGGSVNGTITINGLPKTAVNPYNDIIIYAENVNTGNIFYYSLPDVTSSFKMDNLPAGEYMLRAQIIGLDDAVSKTFTVSPNNPYFDSISIKITTSDVGDALIAPKEFKLFQNYPNPFNPETKIKFTIPGNSSKSVSIKVYDVLGKLITTLVNEKMLPGEYEVNFNGNNLSSGVYFYVLKSGNVSLSQKMILMK
ncbi:MAG: T9SS C-terminal target domain-containing protein, partial [Ignavibacteria bacterium]